MPVAFSACVVPRANEAFAGVTAIETSVGGTVRLVEPEIAPKVAAMDVLPATNPLASPAALIEATPEVEELHATLPVRFWVLLSEYVPVATNCSVAPAVTEEFAGVTAIETRLAAVPVPVKATVCGLLLALSAKLKVPLRVPSALGEKITDAVQLAPAARVSGLIGQVDVTLKSVRLLVTAVMLSVEDWLLVSVTVCAALDVPNDWLRNVRLVGLAVAATIPTPVRLTAGLIVALSLMVRVPVRVPATAGSKNSDTLQFDPAASVFGVSGHVVVSE